jgi:hypothetical protein
MMTRKLVYPVTIVFLLTILVTTTALAGDQNTNSPSVQPSNYCLACHSTGDTRLDDATSWVGGIEHNQISPCPAVAQINEEIYYTERLMLSIERAREQVPSGVDLSKSDSRLIEAKGNYSRMLDAPVTSLEAFSSEARMVRYRLGKVYSAFNQTIETAKRARVLWIAVGVSLVIAASLIWGWVNTQKAMQTPNIRPQKRMKFFVYRIAILILILGFFALPIYRLPSQEIEMTSIEEQERQAILDETARAAVTADRELSRAWMLAQIGAIWSQSDPARGDIALQNALAAAQEAQNNRPVLWGLSQSTWEAGGAQTATQAEAALAAADLDSMRGRAWGLRLIAEAWMSVDAAQAETILEDALAQTEAAIHPYNQLDLRAISVTWAQLDVERGVDLAHRVTDPALRAWALREIASLTNDASIYQAAAEAARMVPDLIQRARVLREVAAESGDESIFVEAASALESLEGGERSLALADLAAASGDASMAAQIDPEHPSAQALANFHLEEYESAWQAASKITDPFDQARAQAAIAGAWGNMEAAMQITIQPLRDRTLWDVSQKTGNTALVDEMEDHYYQVRTLTAAGQYEAALKAAKGLRDGYSLVALGTSWAEVDPQSTFQVVEALNRESDKAVVLNAIAAATGRPEDFERALGMALAARVRGDPLSPVQASLDLAGNHVANPNQFETAMVQAYEAAEKINVKY